MSTTKENLKEAFAGESQANQKYLAFAKAAEKAGFTNIAKLFRTTAQAESIHAEGHFTALGGVGSTAENLEAAIGGETFEHTEMYPPMLEQAEADQHPAQKMFAFALKAERQHAELYKKALEAVRDGKDITATEVWLCPFCGHIELGTPPEICPICGAKASQFVQV
ncbi:MAG: rubrerythrin family protein [Chlorobiaceae bacterium]|nr:rubrerythrin family protein [Chlorobiaceae bacterium]